MNIVEIRRLFHEQQMAKIENSKNEVKSKKQPIVN
jgi:hypothetical protein